ncbi:MAG: hypothetical protein U9R75_10695 [Candidatus Thermoplasmatota archaeon]|nr:hypothetical protein [Candidatus Thermoplasmatota archaeon]
MRPGNSGMESSLTGEQIYERRGWRISPVLRSMTYVTWIPLLLIAIFLISISLIGPILLMRWSLEVHDVLTDVLIVNSLFLALTIALSYVLFSLCLMFVCGLFKRALDPFFGLKEGEYPFISSISGYWSIVNGLILICRQFFLELTRTTFLLVLFYRLMGMRIGKGSLINSTFLYDPDLVVIGKNVTIGGDVMILGHVGEKWILRLKRTVIGDRVDIGQSAFIMPGVVVGEGSIVGAFSVVTKGTDIPPYEIWAGVPAKKIGELKKPPTRS